MLFETDARVRAPYAACQGRSHIGQQILRIYGDSGAGSLRQQAGGKPHRAAADDPDLALAGGHRLAHGNAARPPRQRPAAAAMTVVVHDPLLPDPLDVEARPSSAKRAGADGNLRDAVST